MNLFRINMLVPAALIMAAGLAGAEESADEAAGNPAHIFPTADDIDGTAVEEARTSYLQERNWSLGFHDNNPSGGYIGWGVATIATEPEDRNYGAARITAIDAAIAEALGDFALSRGTNASLVRVRETIHDTNALNDLDPSDNQSVMNAIADRFRDLTAAQLDSALQDLGVDPDKHRELEFVQKVQLAMDSVQTEMVRSARESFQGIRLLKTFEDRGSVGALVIYSPELRSMARRILSGDMAAIGRGNSSDALDQLNGDLQAEELVFMHGTRLLRDSDGNPVIVAFGQASPPVTRADSRQAINMAVTAAQRRANMRADGAMAEFLNSYVVVDEQEMTGVAMEVIGERRSDGSEREVETSTFIRDINSVIRQRSDIDLSGITTARTWRANHPDTGHLHVGAVKLWSPTTQAAFTGRGVVETPEEVAERDAEENGTAVQQRGSPEFGDEDW